MWNKDDAIRLSQIRIKKGISARQMSNDLGLGENYINKIENLSSKELYEAINGLKDLDESDFEHIAAIIKRLRKD